MSFSTPRINIIAIMKKLGFEQVKDAFDFENVGNSRIDKAFHLEQGTISNEATNMQTTAVNNPMTLRYYVQGGRDTADRMTDTLVILDEISNNIFSIENATDGVKIILFDEFTPVPHSDDNDNIIRGELTFTVNQELCFSTNN